MNVAELVGWEGTVDIEVVREGRVVDVVRIRNLITNAGKDLLADCLLEGADAEIRYMAWGDSSTAPAVGDTTLGNEEGRKLVTTKTDSGTGATQTTTILLATEANDQIEELGWFAGPTATETADSGILIARVLYSRLKDDLESIQVTRTDTIGGT